MKIVELIRLIRRHIVLLVIAPVLLAVLVAVLISKPRFSYTSQTVLYTGLATGSSIEMDKSFNYFATNTAFDNLLNIINSRKTQQEVAIRLLSQHLLFKEADPKYISAKSFAELKKIAPASIYNYVSRGAAQQEMTDSLFAGSIDSSDKHNLFPPQINKADFEKTVESLTALMKSSDTNFVYKLLNYEDPHYSIKAISGIKALRIANSDLIKLSYEVDDPGICQQTLAIFNEVCIKNYKAIKENRSDEVVKYFESQLKSANRDLKVAEDKLLSFNKSNNIINYYEQSKAVAVVKEDMEVDYNNKKAQLAGLEAATRRLEDKINIQQLVQLKSSAVLDKKKQLGDISYEIASAEANAESDSGSRVKIPALVKQADALKTDIRKSVDELYSYQHTTDGLPLNKVLSDWINTVVEAENLRAKLRVMDQRNKEFQQQYSVYAPAGANIKRIEREINVSEQGYLEILHGLNLAKLKLQDNELSSDLKAVDPPYYPISPIPTNRKVLVIAAAFMAIIIVLAVILLMEYFDDTLRNQKKAAATLALEPLGMMPKIYLQPGVEHFALVQQRLLGIITQNMEKCSGLNDHTKQPHVVLFFSTMNKEGKSVVAGNISKELQRQGKKVLLLDYSDEYVSLSTAKHFPILHRLLGYQDPRINCNSPLLQVIGELKNNNAYHKANISEAFYKATAYKELPELKNMPAENKPDYIFIELPALLGNNYPSGLVTAADSCVLVCRSNRIWSEADQTALDNITPLMQHKPVFVLNGVETKELESLLGELPKKRSTFRKRLKNFFRFQFYSSNHI